MSDKKILVPEGMLKAAKERVVWNDGEPAASVPMALEAALLWLSENPRVPNDNFGKKFIRTLGGYHEAEELVELGAVEWQRRMFLAPGPEMPEEIKDYLAWAGVYFGDHPQIQELKNVMCGIYRRGLKSGGK